MLIRIALGIIAALAASLAAALPASAAVTVENTNESGPGSLRETIIGAPVGETVVVPAGTYPVGSEIVFKKDLTIVGAGAGQTILDAHGTSAVLRAGAAPITLNLRGFTIQNGHVNSGGGGGQGAAVSFTGATLNLEGMAFANNLVESPGAPDAYGGNTSGGAVYGGEGTVNVVDSSFIANRVSSPGGVGKFGGIAAGGALHSRGQIHVSRSYFAENAALSPAGQGPAAFQQFGGIATGGAIFLSQETFGAVSSIEDSTFVANALDSSGGPGGFGGIAQGGALTLDLENGSASIDNTTFTANTTRNSGAIPTGSVLGYALGARLDDDVALNVRNSTLAGNSGAPTAVPSSSAFLEGDVRISNSIFAGSPGVASCRTQPAESSLVAPTSLGFNIDSADECGFHAAGDRVNTDPLLGSLQDNGGPVPTMLPTANSPAVDQGAPGLAADARGVIRPIDFPAIPNAAGGNGSDVGAAELQPSNLLTIGTLKRNKKKGTATLTVNVPQPSAGTVILEGRFVKTQTVALAGEGSLKLPVIARGKAKKGLRRKGKRKVGLAVTYSPTGVAGASATRTVKLVKKRKHHRTRHKRDRG